MKFLTSDTFKPASAGRILSRLFADRSGNFGMITGLVMVPLIASAGLAIDFGRALELKARLSGAADAAALAAIKAAATAGVSGDTVTLSPEAAKLLFEGNAAPLVDSDTTFGVEAVVQKNQATLTSEVTFNATMPTTLMRVLGKHSMDVSGGATASMELPPYIDFYMLLDNSPSMGLAATEADMDKFMKATGCAFACHETDRTRSSYHVAKDLGIATRIDVVRDSVEQLTKTAESARIWEDQFRIGIYTFGMSAETVKLTTITAPRKNMTTVAEKAAAIDLMTTPYNHYRNNELSIFDESLGGMRDVIGVAGQGTSASSRQKVLFFISDGVAHQYKAKGTCSGEIRESNNSETTCIEPLVIKYCDALKRNGVKIAVLYTTYLPLPNTDWAWRNFVSKIIGRVPTAMEKCASDDLYFEVAKGEDIGRRLHDLFYKITAIPRLTN